MSIGGRLSYWSMGSFSVFTPHNVTPFPKQQITVKGNLGSRAAHKKMWRGQSCADIFRCNEFMSSLDIK